MFKATAFIVGPRDGPGAALADLARLLGFASVLPYQDAAAAEQQAARTPLLFFFFAAVDETAALRPAAAAIRGFPGRRLRFSPLVYFPESPQPEAVRLCVQLGFDDVMTLPFSPERVQERLARQVNRPLAFFETPTYFGPDRRGEAHAGNTERRGGGRHRRFEIVRTPASGVSILRDDMNAA